MSYPIDNGAAPATGPEPTVPLADVLAFAESLRTALALPAGADVWALSGRMAEVRGALAAVAFDGCSPAAAARVLGRIAAGEAGR